MIYNLLLGGLTFCIESREPIVVEDFFHPFLVEGEVPEPDISIFYSLDYACAPPLPSEPMGEDMLIRYYATESGLICETMGGPMGPVAIAVSNRDYTRWICYQNSSCYTPFDHLSLLLRFIPVSIIFQRHDVLFLHASYINMNGRGIMFAAPSGTGKSTQAKLWNKYRKAEIICNDRTLIKDGIGSGYVMDGSDPILSAKSVPLRAIAILEQSPNNEVIKLRGGIALSKLIKQLVFPIWSTDSLSRGYDQMIDLIGECPVYLLRCTPDERAVSCLEQRLIEDGVF